MTAHPARRPSRAQEVTQALRQRIDTGAWRAGDKLPTEGQLMQEYGVSRTVVREALSHLQAAGLALTRHGVGSFVAAQHRATPFTIAPQQVETLRDVVAVLELRIGVETEAAGLAAQRRTEEDLAQLKLALEDFAQALEAGRNAVDADFRFHAGIAQATQNPHYMRLLASFGQAIIPRSRLEGAETPDEPARIYLRRVHVEHENIFDAIATRDAESARAAMRTHLSNSRERRRRAFLLEEA